MSHYSQLPSDFPKPLEALLTWHDYSRGESKFSISDLIAPPQVVQLRRRHDSEIIRDPRENIYSVLGSAVHSVLEELGNKNPEDWQLVERRLFAEIDGVLISGQIDLHCTLESGILTDYKVTKASALLYETKQEWISQVNSYCWLLRRAGMEVTRARCCAIFRDWALASVRFSSVWTPSTTDGIKITCKRTPNYPEFGTEMVEIPMWPNEEVEQFLRRRVALHMAAEKLTDEELALQMPCSLEERWRRDSWRVRKIGAVKAKGNKSNFKTEQEAREYQQKMGDEFEVSSRPGIPYKCAFYCDAAPFCAQLKNEGFEVTYEIAGDTEEPTEQFPE